MYRTCSYHGEMVSLDHMYSIVQPFYNLLLCTMYMWVWPGVVSDAVRGDGGEGGEGEGPPTLSCRWRHS